MSKLEQRQTTGILRDPRPKSLFAFGGEVEDVMGAVTGAAK